MTLPAEIASQYDALGDALERRDAAGLATVVSDAAARNTMWRNARAFVSLRVRVDCGDAQTHGDSVVVSAQYTYDGLQPVPKGKPQPHHSITAVVDTWRFVSGVWRLVSEAAAQQTEIVD